GAAPSPAGPSPWRFAPVPPPKQTGGGTRARFARGSNPRERGGVAGIETAPQLVACPGTSATPQPVVRAGGLRVVVAANSFAPLPRGPDRCPPSPPRDDQHG